MILKSFRYFCSLVILLIICVSANSEEKIDIWKDKKNNTDIKKDDASQPIKKEGINFNAIQNKNNKEAIQIEEGIEKNLEDLKIFGVHDPADYNFTLNMWSTTNADDVRASLKRIKKINLSKTSNEILENVLMSFSYPPYGMSEKEFVDLKINWLIENDKRNLIEKFLKQNENFKGKRKAVQYLVDKNIAQADIKNGCEKVKFIDSSIKDAYLEKFKIYCLIFNNKNSEAQLLLDLLREQNQSDKFFDDKINFLLGISSKVSEKINEKNLLNFYLSSVTIKNFSYTPSQNTKKEIWNYLNAANLIKLDDVSDKKRLSELENAANLNQVDNKIIYDIYKQIPFNLNTLINAKNLYQTLENSDARALLYQKYLLSDSADAKVEYLFLLEELFVKDKLQNVYSLFLSENLKKIGLDNIPDNYKEIAKKRIKSETNLKQQKVKYNDKILHQSKIIKYYLEKEDYKKIQKDIDKIFKKISKNKKYFYSAKDLALVDSLSKDGFKIPENFNRSDIASKYDVPKNLFQLIEKKQEAFLTLKIIEIIGEDEPYELDPETIYFITNLLNEMDLIKIRNKVLISALPLRA